jgi:cytoskeletal protein CcmA (bactofilin family)
VSPEPTPAPAAIPPAAAPRGPPITDRGMVRYDRLRSRRWKLRGIAKVAQEVDVEEGRLDGTVVVGGPLLAGELSVRGHLEVRGALTVAGRLTTRGSLEAGASVRAGEAELQGRLRVAGDLVAESRLRTQAIVWARSIQADRLELRGAVHVSGPVVGATIDASFDGNSALGAVRGGTVRLHGPAPNPVRRVLGPEVTVSVERIDAESVFLASARVGFVRASQIVLGPGARVASAEGTVAKAHRTSHLGPESWTPPPEGLRR